MIDNTFFTPVSNHLTCVGPTLTVLVGTHRNDDQPATLMITTLSRREPTPAESVTVAANMSTDEVVGREDGRDEPSVASCDGAHECRTSRSCVSQQCVQYQPVQPCLLAKFGSRKLSVLVVALIGVMPSRSNIAPCTAAKHTRQNHRGLLPTNPFSTVRK